MKKTNLYKDKKILVLGLAKSGFAAAKLLHHLGAKVVINDQKPYEENKSAQELEKAKIEVICGGHPLDLLDRNFDLIVKNPGIPYHIPFIQKAIEKGIPIITEVEVAYNLSQADIVGITGSNGKTTTTTLIYEILKADHRDTFISGNIGTVACEVAAQTKENQLMVMELSSFQLMGTLDFKPKVSVLLNLFDAHLDYHGTRKEYGKAKANLFKTQDENDFCVYSLDHSDVVKLTKDVKAKHVPFSVMKRVDKGASIVDGLIYFKGEEVISVADIALPGKHNLENILATICAVKVLGVSNEAIKTVLNTFTGVKHRLQFVDTINGRKFFNDSKATNILATEKAITAFLQPVILLAGGLDRGNSFDDLIPALKSVKAVVTFGQTAKKIEEGAIKAGINTIKHVDNVEKAVLAAYEISKEDDVILLSPACASWDQYKTFEERGDMFIKSVHRLKVKA